MRRIVECSVLVTSLFVLTNVLPMGGFITTTQITEEKTNPIIQTSNIIFIANTFETLEQEDTTIKEDSFIPYQIPLDVDIQRYIYEKCIETGIPFELVLALIEKESCYTSDVISKTNDYGLMQINKFNHEWLSEELNLTDFLDEKQNIDAGIYMLSDLFDRETDLDKVLMMYNCGPTGAKRLWNKGIYETSYSKEVISKMNKIKEMEK